MPHTLRASYLLSAIVGGITALTGIVLSGAFLALAGNGALGPADPFIELTVDGVRPLQAAIWTYFDALGVAPVVTWDSPATASVLVRRGVLTAVHGDAAAALRLLPPVLLTFAGGAAVVLTRHLSRDGGGRDATTASVGPGVGSAIALGYAPVSVLALRAGTVPVAPESAGVVAIGGTTVKGTVLSGVTAGPSPLVAMLVAIGYPLLFGLVGGGLVSFVNIE